MTSSEPQAFQDELDKAVQAFRAGQTEESIGRAEAARRLNPGAAEPLYLLGLAAVSLNDIGAAIRMLEEAHRSDPDGREIAEALGVAHGRAGNLSESLYYTKLALALDENPRLAGLVPQSFLDFEANIGGVRQSAYLMDASLEFFMRRFDQAADLCRRELNLRPGNVEAHRLMGRVALELGRYEEATESLERAARLAPRDADGFVYWAEGLRKQGRLDGALECCREAMRLDPASVAARCQLLTTLAYMPFAAWRTYADEAQAAVAAFAPETTVPSSVPPVAPAETSNKPDTKIQIAFLVNETAMLRDIAFFESFLAHYDRKKFFVRVYQQYSRIFGETSRLQNEADDWRPVYNIDDETLAFIAGNDGIEVLVDLCGASPDGRPAFLARRPAPVRIGWLGFPQGSLPGTGDWVLSDSLTAECDARDSGGMRTCRLGGGFMSYLGASVALEDETADKNRPPVVVNGYVTFGAVLDPARIVGSMALWERVLREDPDARLLLGRAPTPDEGTRRRLLALFEQHGVGDRVVIQGETEGNTAPAAFYTAIDILLDSLPVNGTMELCEALWRGVPVVTCLGDRRAGRIGAAILSAAGRDDWIAKTPEDFTALAHRLASDRSALTAWRKTLPGEFKKSRLCDAKKFATEFGALFESLATTARAPAK
ncbi:MAG: tetratricopeptide repeat protein [Pseudomonadota bacterium]